MKVKNKKEKKEINIDHKGIWLSSMKGMTFGFIATLAVGAIIGILALPFDGKENIFQSIKNALVFLAPFGIGVGVGLLYKKNPLQVLAIGIASFIAGRSMFHPIFDHTSGGFDFSGAKINILLNSHNNVLMGMDKTPGDVLSAWLTGVLMLYLFEFYKKTTAFDLFIVPIVGVFVGIAAGLSITYVTSLVTAVLEWVIFNTISKELWKGLLLAPILGALMGLAMSLPISSAGIAVAVHMKGDAAMLVMAATAAQMISFGIMTYMNTGKVSKSLSVAFGTSMLQMNNFSKKPLLLLIPTLASAFAAIIALAVFHGNQLPFIADKHNPDAVSVTPGMGTSAAYGQIFTLKENGWDSWKAWTHVLALQLAFPVIFTIPSMMWFEKMGWIKKGDLAI